ncbi:hypothetical protein LUZ60_012877 [Juncus effusus]|nr:hypothetical protein LUZ60_012877 [Juncus effusus]
MDFSAATSHAKLLAADLLDLTVHTTTPPSFSRGNYPITHVEVLGIVVAHKPKPNHLLFLLDDGTGIIPCIMWLSPRHIIGSASSDPTAEIERQEEEMRRRLTDPTEEINREMAESVKHSELVRVRGKVSVYKGEIQITVRDVVVENDPNMETLHWLDCIRLARDVYDLRN